MEIAQRILCTEAIAEKTKTILDKLGAEITVDENAKRIILYHGTRAPAEKIFKEGLLVAAGLKGRNAKLQMIDEVLTSEFGVTREQIPEWIWIWEYKYEQTKPPHLHMSINLGTAIGYSHQGCEVKAQIRRNMFIWLLMRRYGDFSIKDFEEKLFPNLSYSIISEIACKRNGENSYVFQVEVPKNYIYKEDLSFWRDTVTKVKKLNNFEILKTTTMEVRVVRDIPPEMIRRCWKVNWKKGYSWIGGKYELEELNFQNPHFS